LVMRDTIERYEAVEAGSVRLVGASADNIYSSVSELLAQPSKQAEIAQVANPFRDGNASKRIVSALLDIHVK